MQPYVKLNLLQIRSLVNQTAPQVQQQAQLFTTTLLFDVPNTDGKLRIDMTAQVYIVLNSAKMPYWFHLLR